MTKQRKQLSGRKTEATSKRTYLKQSDVPAGTIDEALRVPQAIIDHYAGKPTNPLYVAKALNVDPKGSQLKVLTGAAIAFGLIEGGAQASTIIITDLAKRILKPKIEGDDLIARRQAVLTPRIFKQFLMDYNGSPFPRKDIAVNVLEGMGVPGDKSSEVFERILSSARKVGFIEDIRDKAYVTIQDMDLSSKSRVQPERNEDTLEEEMEEKKAETPLQGLKKEIQIQSHNSSSLAIAIVDDERRRKVFITHGKNQALVEPIKKLLEYGELAPIISVQRQSVSKPVPEKVMDDMRGCGAAIIHVDAESTIIDKEGKEQVIINPNVLIEIGAAMAFYGRRFILLVREGVKLPSNLQGLYEVRYSNDILDANATIKLLGAIKDIKNYSLPSDISAN